MMSEQAMEIWSFSAKESESVDPVVVLHFKLAAIQWMDIQDSIACRLTTTQS